MKKLLYGLIFAALASSAFGQQTPVTSQLYASSTNCTVTGSCLVLNLPVNAGGATITIAASPSFSATVQFEITGDGTTWVSANGTTPTQATASSATGSGSWQFNTVGYVGLRARVSSFASGLVPVTSAYGPGVSARNGGAAVPSGTAMQGLFFGPTAAPSSEYGAMNDTTLAPSGSDAGSRAQSCFTQLASFYVGACWNGNESNPDLLVNPFGYTSGPSKPIYVLGQFTKTEQPVTIAAGDTWATSLNEGEAELRGLGEGVGADTFEKVGSTLEPGSSFFGAGSTSPCALCVNFGTSRIAYAYVDDGHNSGLNGAGNPCPTITWASSTATATGRTCYVLSSGTFTTWVQKGDWLMVPNSALASVIVGGQVVSQIDNVIDNLHATGISQIANANSNGGLMAGGYTWSMQPSVENLGIGTDGVWASGEAGGYVNMGLVSANHTINVNQKVSNCITNAAAPEMNSIHDLHFIRYIGVCMDVETASGQSSRFWNLMFTCDPSLCQTNSTGLVLNETGPMSGYNLIFNNPSTTMDIAEIVNAVNYYQFFTHYEHARIGLWLNNLPSCATDPCPGMVYPTGPVHDLLFEGSNFSCDGNPVTYSCPDSILVDNGSNIGGSGLPYNVDFENVTCGGDSANITNLLRDVNNSNTLTCANNPSITSYKIGPTGTVGDVYAELKDCAEMTNGWCRQGSTLSFYSSGSVVISLNGSSGLLSATNLALAGYITLAQISVPSDPSSGHALVYVNSSTALLSCLLPSGSSCLPSTKLFTNPPGGISTAYTLAATGTAYFGLFTVQQPVTFSNLYYNINSADSTGTDHYDLWVASCPSDDCSQPGVTASVVCDTGGIAQTGTGPQKTQCTQSVPITIQPGTYIIAVCGNATTAKYGESGVAQMVPFSSVSVASVCTGGVAASFTTPSAGTQSDAVNSIGFSLH